MGWKGWQTFLTRAVSLTCLACVPAKQGCEIVTAPVACSKCISAVFHVIENGFEILSEKMKQKAETNESQTFLSWKHFGFKNRNNAVKETTNTL